LWGSTVVKGNKQPQEFLGVREFWVLRESTFLKGVGQKRERRRRKEGSGSLEKFTLTALRGGPKEVAHLVQGDIGKEMATELMIGGQKGKMWFFQIMQYTLKKRTADKKGLIKYGNKENGKSLVGGGPTSGMPPSEGGAKKKEKPFRNQAKRKKAGRQDLNKKKSSHCFFRK